MSAFAVPSNAAVPVALPDRLMYLTVCNCVAEFALPYKSALTTDAEKLPSESLLTMTLAVFALVASSTRST